MTLRAIILAVAALLHRGPPPAYVVTAIEHAAATPDEAALLTTYAALESSYDANPKPYSWDAKAGRACGIWQMLCWRIGSRSVDEQARMWMQDVRKYGLSMVTGSAKEAARRQHLAAALLERVGGR